MVKQNMPFLIAVFLLVLYSGFLFGQVGSPAALRKTVRHHRSADHDVVEVRDDEVTRVFIPGTTG